MQSKISTSGLRFGLWYFNKIMRRAIHGLFVDTASVDKVKQLIAANHKVIFIPLYRTYADFFVQLYVMMTQKIKLGFTFGNFEDTPRTTFFDTLLRSSGYITSRRRVGQSLQSNFVNGAFLKEVISHN